MMVCTVSGFLHVLIHHLRKDMDPQALSQKDGLYLDQMLTVIISTKNRWEDLNRALQSLRSQTLPHQVIVMDDNSDDSTFEKTQQLYPEVKALRFNESKGYIVRRNEAVQLATTPYVLSIDDDCILESPEILAQIATFCQQTKCAAVAWPYVDVNTNKKVESISPDGGLWQACTFKGCAFVVQRETFLQLGGFRSVLVHQGEEEDFCIRLLDAGHPVLLGTGTAISHYESPKRSWKRMDYYGSRNLMLFAFFNVPTSVLPIQLAGSAVKSILFGFKIKRPYDKTRGVFHGFSDGFKLMRERKPVSMKTYRKYRELKKSYQKLADINA
ncbi:glycosyltransferase family 2 protein [Paracnuella aquatica]|uniref:glycosyltransferase family 2 protein n=1 Tax=Paracnuella aquatica TaxID=2268757 RepID=UPI000DEFA165|nr:glycosyltransferase family 2 protein [Paracnuella aquatica]